MLSQLALRAFQRTRTVRSRRSPRGIQFIELNWPSDSYAAIRDFHGSVPNPSSSSTRWKKRQSNDSYSREAKVQGLKSRAAFKLLEVCGSRYWFSITSNSCRLIQSTESSKGGKQWLISQVTRFPLNRKYTDLPRATHQEAGPKSPSNELNPPAASSELISSPRNPPKAYPPSKGTSYQ